MNTSLLLPKYLTAEIAAEAVAHALSLAFHSTLSPKMKRLNQCHVVVLVPAMVEAGYSWPNYQIQPHALFERSVGDKTQWEHEYDHITRCKALQLWHDRNDDRTAIIPHLLFPGDTPFWGGVKHRGFVVVCSGVQAHFDKMISGVSSDIMVALAHDAFELDEHRKAGADFLV